MQIKHYELLWEKKKTNIDPICLISEPRGFPVLISVMKLTGNRLIAAW